MSTGTFQHNYQKKKKVIYLKIDTTYMVKKEKKSTAISTNLPHKQTTTIPDYVKKCAKNTRGKEKQVMKMTHKNTIFYSFLFELY